MARRHRHRGHGWTLAVALLLAAAHTAHATPTPPAASGANLADVRTIEIEAYPSQQEATSQFGTTGQEAVHAPTWGDVVAPLDSPASSSSSSSSSSQQPRVSTVWTPISPQILDDDAPSLFTFPSSVVHSFASTSGLPPGSAPTTSFAPLVLRVQRRVTSVGMWQPPDAAKVHPMHRREWEERNGVEPGQAPPILPPLTAPTIVTSTLNLLVTAHYRVRPGQDVYRGIQLHVLPGPSFQRGSLSALAERFGAESIGFEQAFHSMHDLRQLASLSAADGTEAPGEIVFQQDPTEVGRLPGYGPLSRVRTLSGQHNENWIMYRSGIYDEKRRQVHEDVAIYMLLVHAWNDPPYAKEQLAAYEASLSSPSPPSDAMKPPSLNALGVRLRVASAQFTIRPVEHGTRLFRPQVAKQDREARLAALVGVQPGEQPAASAAPVAPEEALLDREIVYAKVVDFVAYQQRKFLFIGVAYSDGFIRVYARNGTLRNELHTRNATILTVALSNFGSSSSATSAHAGGAREANSALNGMQNGNHLMAYVTPTGIGLVKLARIYQEIDQYCRWRPDHSDITSGYDVSAVAFDAHNQGVMYLASHVSLALIIMSTRVGGSVTGGGGGGGPEPRFHPEGSECHFATELPISMSPTASSLTRAWLTHPHPLGPALALHSARGLLFVLSAAAGTMHVWNTTRVNEIPRGPGAEWMYERQVVDPAQLPTDASSSSASIPSLQVAALIGDRIDLLLVGSTVDCSTPTGVCSSPAATPGSPSPSPPSTVVHVFQLFLPSSSLAGSSGASWMTLTRTPLFLLGLLGMLGYQWMQRKKRLRKEMGLDDDGDEDADSETEATQGPIAMRRRKGRRKAAAGGRMRAHVPMSEEEERALLAHLGGKASAGSSAAMHKAASNSDPFDSQQFMEDFLHWQKKTKKGGAGGTSAAPPRGGARGMMEDFSTQSAGRYASSRGGNLGDGSSYMAELAGERARLEGNRGRTAPSSSKYQPSAATIAASRLAGAGAKSSANFSGSSRSSAARGTGVGAAGVGGAPFAGPNDFERQRIEMRRRLDQMDDARAAKGARADAIQQDNPSGGYVEDPERPIFGPGVNSYADDADDGAADPTDGMQYEHGFDGESYEDEEDGDVAAAESSATPAGGASRDARATVSDDEDDGPTFHGAYDAYQYDPTQYAPRGGAGARVNGGGGGVGSGGASDPKLRTFPIDEIITDEAMARELAEERATAVAVRRMQARGANPSHVPAPLAAPTGTIAGFGHSADDATQYDEFAPEDFEAPIEEEGEHGIPYDDEARVYGENYSSPSDDEEEEVDGEIDTSRMAALHLQHDDLVNEEADAAGEEWVDEEVVQASGAVPPSSMRNRMPHQPQHDTALGVD